MSGPYTKPRLKYPRWSWSGLSPFWSIPYQSVCEGEVAHDCGDRDLGGSTSSSAAFVFDLELGAEAHGYQRWHVKRRTDSSAAAANESVAAPPV